MGEEESRLQSPTHGSIAYVCMHALDNWQIYMSWKFYFSSCSLIIIFFWVTKKQRQTWPPLYYFVVQGVMFGPNIVGPTLLECDSSMIAHGKEHFDILCIIFVQNMVLLQWNVLQWLEFNWGEKPNENAAKSYLQ